VDLQTTADLSRNRKTEAELESPPMTRKTEGLVSRPNTVAQSKLFVPAEATRHEGRGAETKQRINCDREP